MNLPSWSWLAAGSRFTPPAWLPSPSPMLPWERVHSLRSLSQWTARSHLEGSGNGSWNVGWKKKRKKKKKS